MEHLRTILKFDAGQLYRKGTDIYVSKKEETSQLECMKLTSNDVKKYAKKYNINSNKKEEKIDISKLNDEKYNFYKKEILPDINFAKKANENYTKLRD